MAKTSTHILGTSANLLGFCLFIITSLHITDKAENSLIDEFTTFIALMLTASSIFSFASIKTNNPKLEGNLERVADYLFVISLIGIFSIIVFMFFTYFKR